MAQQPHFSIQTIVGPSFEALTLDQAKSHLRVSIPDDDDYIADLITAARQAIEAITGRAMIQATYLLSMDRFPLLPNTQYSPGNPSILVPVVNNVWPLDASAWAIFLPRSPLVSVTSIQYTDTAGNLQTLDPSGYSVDASSEPPRLAPLAGAFWPPTMWTPNSVRVTFVAGYPSASAVPASYRHALRLLLGHWYENREAVTAGAMMQLPLALDSLLALNTVQGIF